MEKKNKRNRSQELRTILLQKIKQDLNLTVENLIVVKK